MMTFSNGSILRVTDPLCGELTGHRWIPRTKASDGELWCFLWSAPWINLWVNNREAGDLRRHRAHYEIIVMFVVVCCVLVILLPRLGPYLSGLLNWYWGNRMIVSQLSYMQAVTRAIIAPLWDYVFLYAVQHTVYPKKYAHGFALLCFVVVIHWLIFPYPSGLLHWHWGNLTIAPVPAKQPWWIWINTSCEFIMNDCITTTKQSTTKPCAYFLGYTVSTCSWTALNESVLITWLFNSFVSR